ncbi:MAG TPA: four helix bundle protein [Anaerolineales bacterium]|jgi:four helix bundle protein
MSATFEDLRILKIAEEIADSIWNRVIQWDEFAKDVVGKQLTRAADSIGANIAESFGRYHFGERLQFLYYARGSIFETKFWLNRAKARGLLSPSESQAWIENITALARQLNAFAGSLKAVRTQESKNPKTVREATAEYRVDPTAEFPETLFTAEELTLLQS